MLWARFLWVFVCLVLCMGGQSFFMYRVLREIVLIRRNEIENHISTSGLKKLWSDDVAGTLPPWDTEKDRAKKLATPILSVEKIKAMSGEERQGYAKDLVLAYGGSADDPPPNPLGRYRRTVQSGRTR